MIREGWFAMVLVIKGRALILLKQEIVNKIWERWDNHLTYKDANNPRPTVNWIKNEYTDISAGTIDEILSDLVVSGHLEITKSNYYIYPKKRYIVDGKGFKDAVKQNIKKAAVNSISLDINNIYQMILILLGTFISTFFTYKSLSSSVIQIPLAFFITVCSAVLLSNIFYAVRYRKIVSTLSLIIFFIPCVAYNMFNSINYFYKDYEAERVRAADPNIEKLKTVNYQIEIQNKNIIGMLDTKKARLEIATSSTNEQTKKTYEWTARRLNNEIKTAKNELEKLIEERDSLTAANTAKDTKRSIYQAISESLKIDANIIFMLIALLPSLLVDLIVPIMFALLVNKEGEAP